jgi:uncharacterized caspase-like protein
VDVEDETLSLDRVLRTLDQITRLRLVILDACRDNPFTRTMKRTIASRSVGRGLAKVEPTTSDTLIAFAAKAGSTALDGDTKNSPFTTALLRHLTTPGLDLRLAFGQIRDDVLKATSNRQEPFVYGSLGGSAVALVPASEPKVAAPLPAAKDSIADARRDYYEEAAAEQAKAEQIAAEKAAIEKAVAEKDAAAKASMPATQSPEAVAAEKAKVKVAVTSSDTPPQSAKPAVPGPAKKDITTQDKTQPTRKTATRHVEEEQPSSRRDDNTLPRVGTCTRHFALCRIGRSKNGPNPAARRAYGTCEQRQTICLGTGRWTDKRGKIHSVARR